MVDPLQSATFSHYLVNHADLKKLEIERLPPQLQHVWFQKQNKRCEKPTQNPTNYLKLFCLT